MQQSNYAVNDTVWKIEGDNLIFDAIIRGIAHTGMIGVEVGAWTGKMSAFVGQTCKENGGHLYCVDHWRGNAELYYQEASRDYDVCAIFRDNMKRFKLEDNVFAMAMPSDDALRIFKDDCLDFVIWDCQYEYTPCKPGIAGWFAKVKPGGIILGHGGDAEFSSLSQPTKDFLLANKELTTISTLITKDDLFGLRHMDWREKMVGKKWWYHAGLLVALDELFSNSVLLIPNSTVWVKRRV